MLSQNEEKSQSEVSSCPPARVFFAPSFSLVQPCWRKAGFSVPRVPSWRSSPQARVRPCFCSPVRAASRTSQPCLVCPLPSDTRMCFAFVVLTSGFITSADPKAASGAGRFPGKGFCPDNPAECQRKDKHPKASDTSSSLHTLFTFDLDVKIKRKRREFVTDGLHAQMIHDAARALYDRKVSASIWQNYQEISRSVSSAPFSALLPSVLHKSRHARLVVGSQRRLARVWITDTGVCGYSSQVSAHRSGTVPDVDARFTATAQEGVPSDARQTLKENGRQWAGEETGGPLVTHPRP